MKTPLAILIAGLLIALAILADGYLDRWALADQRAADRERWQFACTLRGGEEEGCELAWFTDVRK